jgi:hypothetical protein
MCPCGHREGAVLAPGSPPERGSGDRRAARAATIPSARVRRFSSFASSVITGRPSYPTPRVSGWGATATAFMYMLQQKRITIHRALQRRVSSQRTTCHHTHCPAHSLHTTCGWCATNMAHVHCSKDDHERCTLFTERVSVAPTHTASRPPQMTSAQWPARNQHCIPENELQARYQSLSSSAVRAIIVAAFTRSPHTTSAQWRAHEDRSCICLTKAHRAVEADRECRTSTERFGAAQYTSRSASKYCLRLCISYRYI